MELLKTIRNKIGLNQQDMATLIGITRDHYAMVESGRRIMPAAAAEKFAALLPLLQYEVPMQPKGYPAVD